MLAGGVLSGVLEAVAREALVAEASLELLQVGPRARDELRLVRGERGPPDGDHERRVHLLRGGLAAEAK